MLEDLKNLIDDWLKERSTRNLSLLSRQSGVPYPTLRRVYQQENTPTLETVLAILNIVATSPSALTFLSEHFSNVGNWVGKIVKGMDSQITSGEINEELRDRISFAIITMASAGGTTMGAIERKFGAYGVEKLKSLMEMDAIYERDGLLLFRDQNFSVLDPRIILEEIKHTVDLFDLKQAGDPGVCAQLHTDGLNDTGVEELNQCIYDFESNLRQIFAKHRGPHVVMLSYVSSFLHKGEL